MILPLHRELAHPGCHPDLGLTSRNSEEADKPGLGVSPRRDRDRDAAAETSAAGVPALEEMPV